MFAQGEPASGIFVVADGRACVSLSDPQGVQVWSRIVGPGAILGLPSAVSGQPYSLSAIALDNLEAAFIPCSTVQDVMARDNGVAADVVRTLSEELRELRRKMALLNGGRTKRMN